MPLTPRLSRRGSSGVESEERKGQEQASLRVQRHWRGLTRRVAVLRKWTWVVSNNLENKEQEHLLDLGLFVKSIEEELSPAPSLLRRSTSGLKELSHSRQPQPPEASAPTPRFLTLRFPLREADVLEMIAGFSRGQRLHQSSVEEILSRQEELMQPLPNIVHYEVILFCLKYFMEQHFI